MHAPTCPPLVLRCLLQPKESVGRLLGRCAPRDSGCAPRGKFWTATSQPPHSTQVTSRSVSKTDVGRHTTYYIPLGQATGCRCWQPFSAVTATRDVAWRVTIDAGRLVPRRKPHRYLGARSCCVEVEYSLLEPTSANSPPGVSRRHDRTQPSPFSRLCRRKGRGEARGAGPGHPRRGCMPASPVVGVRRQPNRTSARLWCAYRTHPLRLEGPDDTTGGAGFLKRGKNSRLV